MNKVLMSRKVNIYIPWALDEWLWDIWSWYMAQYMVYSL